MSLALFAPSPPLESLTKDRCRGVPQPKRRGKTSSKYFSKLPASQAYRYDVQHLKYTRSRAVIQFHCINPNTNLKKTNACLSCMQAWASPQELCACSPSDLTCKPGTQIQIGKNRNSRHTFSASAENEASSNL